MLRRIQCEPLSVRLEGSRVPGKISNSQSHAVAF